MRALTTIPPPQPNVNRGYLLARRPVTPPTEDWAFLVPFFRVFLPQLAKVISWDSRIMSLHSILWCPPHWAMRWMQSHIQIRCLSGIFVTLPQNFDFHCLYLITQPNYIRNYRLLFLDKSNVLDLLNLTDLKGPDSFKLAKTHNKSVQRTGTIQFFLTGQMCSINLNTSTITLAFKISNYPISKII